MEEKKEQQDKSSEETKKTKEQNKRVPSKKLPRNVDSRLRNHGSKLEKPRKNSGTK